MRDVTRDLPVPRRMEQLLEALGADTEFRDAVLGDLAEEFAIRASADGEDAARSWYYSESLRVAPYLVRDWWRSLRGGDVARFAGIVLLSSAALNVFEVVTRVVVFALPGFGSLWDTLLGWGIAGPLLFQAIMLLWTFVDGMFGGYVAARLGSRAPLTGALALGAAFGIFMLLTTILLVDSSPIALAFRSLNIATLVAGIITGGVLVSARAPRRPDGHTEDSGIASG